MARNTKRTKEQELAIRLKWIERQRDHERREKERYKEVAYYDALTREARVSTRFGFEERLKNRLTEVEARTLRGEVRQNVLLLIDLDEFKAINDTYGHQIGDEAIVAAAKAIQERLRDSDVLGRLGGDEFVILARVRDEAGLNALKDRIKNNIMLERVHCGDKEIRLRASVGATFIYPGDSVERVLDRADQLMYIDKEANKAK
jgi:diguanylate cyclase (GGDEF)-like protein